MRTDREQPAGEPAAGPRAPRRAPLHLLRTGLGAALALALVTLLARELIAARIPQDRAALEQLIRDQTGLEVRFARLTVRWGWYGPEAQLSDLTLGAPDAAPLLTARELTVGIDTWRSLRTGAPEAARIRVRGAEIDLDAGRGPAPAGYRPAVAAEPLQLLARWRGGRIDLEEARVHFPVARAPLTVTLAHATLVRLGSQWSAAAEVLLPDTLGARARIAAHLEGDIARRATLHGTVTLAADHLDLGGWRALAAQELRAVLPERGEGRVDLEMQVKGGEAARVAGLVRTRGVRFAPRGAPGVALAFARLDADAQLTRTARGEWRLALGSIDTGVPGGPASALLMIRGAAARGNLHGLAAQDLAAFAAWADGGLPLESLRLAGEVRSLNFDWDPARARGERLAASALARLDLADPEGGLRLTGLDAAVTLTDAALAAELRGEDSRLHVARTRPVVLEGLHVAGELHGTREGARWTLVSDALQVTRAAARVQARASWSGAPGVAPQLHAALSLAAVPLAEAVALVPPQTLAALAPAAARARAGQIKEGELEWHGTPASLHTRGTLEFTGAALAAEGEWPGIEGLDGRIEWQDAQVRARLAGARSGTLELRQARAGWDVSGHQPFTLSAQLTGGAREALGWLRSRPQLAQLAPGLAAVDLDGASEVQVDLAIPRAPGGPRARSRILATLAGARLRPFPGFAPIEALRGTLAFSDGHLQRSSLAGTWAGGPVVLQVSEQPGGNAAALAISARGTLAPRALLLAAGLGADRLPLSGTSEWSARLQAQPGGEGRLRWQLKGDASLVALGSRLPEPLGKNPGSPLPLHLAAEGRGEEAQVRVTLGTRLNSVLALTRAGERWRIARGALRLDERAAELPPTEVFTVDGHLARLDLAQQLGLWRASGALVPAVAARVSAGELVLGDHRFPAARLSLQSGLTGAQLDVEAGGFVAGLQWPLVASAEHPVRVHVAALEASPADAALAPALAAIAAAPVQVAIGTLSLGGRPLGRLEARIEARADTVTLSALRLTGPVQTLEASGQCLAAGECTARASLEGTDLALLLATLGFRADTQARRVALSGELRWPRASGAPLATLAGQLHMTLEDGAVGTPGPGSAAPPFAPLIVPALVDGLVPEAPPGSRPEPARALHFARLDADYTVRDGVAATDNLHLDGDAEILVRARVGLLRQDYDGEAFILRGEERLPQAVRGMGPTPKVAALWLSLRDWFTGRGPGGARTVLRLRGTWNDPIVSAADPKEPLSAPDTP